LVNQYVFRRDRWCYTSGNDNRAKPRSRILFWHVISCLPCRRWEEIELGFFTMPAWKNERGLTVLFLLRGLTPEEMWRSSYKKESGSKTVGVVNPDFDNINDWEIKAILRKELFLIDRSFSCNAELKVNTCWPA
jgi:hypothetical protein